MTDINRLITDNIDVWSSAIELRKTTGRGSNNKIRLKGIDNLRNLIIELALQGRLVQQNSSDFPAMLLINEAKQTRAELLKKKLIKKQSAKVNYEQLEKPYNIPSGWCWSSIGELCEITPKNDLSDEIDVSFIPMPLVSTSYTGEHGQEIRKWGEVKKGFTHFADGDIALAKITPCFENSKAAIFSGLKNGVGSGTTELHVARPLLSKINPRYLLLFLKSPIFLTVGESKMTGSAGQKRVPKDFFTTFSLPLAPAEEQGRIVSKVDELMALCDQLEQQTKAGIDAHRLLVEELLLTLTNSKNAQEFEQNWGRIAKHFDLLFTTEHSIEQLKQTILQLAVMGRLVSQDSTHTPAKENLIKLKRQKEKLIQEKAIKKPKALSPFSDDEKHFELPRGWIWAQIGELGNASESSIVDGPFGSSISTKTDYIESGVPVTRMSNISPFKYKKEDLKFVTPSKFSELRRHNILSKDVLLGKVGSIGNAVVYPDDMPEGLIATTGVARFRVGEVITSELMCYFLNALGPKLRSIASQAVQPFLNMKTINSCLIGLPPLEEQIQIVEKLDQLMSLCNHLKRLLLQANETQANLSEAIIDNALN
mgnify:CR=1 FL=1